MQMMGTPGSPCEPHLLSCSTVVKREREKKKREREKTTQKHAVFNLSVATSAINSGVAVVQQWCESSSSDHKNQEHRKYKG